MQWTVLQIQAELGHLDAQALSYIERCKMTPGADHHKCKVLLKWFKAQTALMIELLAELGTQYPSIHAEVHEEQASAGFDPNATLNVTQTRFKPSMN